MKRKSSTTEKYFSDTPDGVFELAHTYCMNNEEFSERFPGISGKSQDGLRLVGIPLDGDGDKNPLPVTRIIQYKNRPSKHECNARCRHARGPIMICECACGGKYHGTVE